MGGSTASAASFTGITSIPDASGKSAVVPITIFDTIHPDSVARLERSLDLEDTLFIISSQSGTTTETKLLERWFRAKAGDNSEFIAVTRRNSAIARRSAQFSHVFEIPDKVAGRFSALSIAGILPLMLAGLDMKYIATSSVAMARSCMKDEESNPGLRLAAALCTAAEDKNKLIITLSPRLWPLARWIEQIVAESLCKDGRGVIPIVSRHGESVITRGSTFIRIDHKSDHHNKIKPTDTTPDLQMVTDSTEIGGEMFRWQFATVATAAAIGVNPFDQPDVESAKQITNAMLEQNIEPIGSEEVSSVERLIEEIKKESTKDTYVAITAWLDENPKTEAQISELQKVIIGCTSMPVIIGYGPRYLHSIGQMLKGGPNTVCMVAIVPETPANLTTGYENPNLGKLLIAQCFADIQAMRENRRKVILYRPDSRSD